VWSGGEEWRRREEEEEEEEEEVQRCDVDDSLKPGIPF
jgi:hypothetical protein